MSVKNLNKSQKAERGEKSLGEFEILVLAAVMRLGADAYGVSIRRQLEERCRRAVSVGALYATLSRLEEKGLVHSHLGEATPERGGRAKKYFEISTSGRQRLQTSLSALRNMTEGLHPWPESTARSAC